MNDNDNIPNPALAAYVSSYSFVLTLRKTHIATLVEIAHGVRNYAPTPRDFSPSPRSLSSYFVTAVKALCERGLVVHRYRPNFVGKNEGVTAEPITNYYRLTKAGWLMFDLLVEAGLAVPTTAKRRLVA